MEHSERVRRNYPDGVPMFGSKLVVPPGHMARCPHASCDGRFVRMVDGNIPICSTCGAHWITGRFRSTGR